MVGRWVLVPKIKVRILAPQILPSPFLLEMVCGDDFGRCADHVVESCRSLRLQYFAGYWL